MSPRTARTRMAFLNSALAALALAAHVAMVHRNGNAACATGCSVHGSVPAASRVPPLGSLRHVALDARLFGRRERVVCGKVRKRPQGYEATRLFRRILPHPLDFIRFRYTSIKFIESSLQVR